MDCGFYGIDTAPKLNLLNCICFLHFQLRKVKEKTIKRAPTATVRQIKKANAIARPVIELPTTEPDLDCYATVSDLDDDDDIVRRSTSAAAIASGKLVRTQHRQLQLNLVEQKMPPELTVTGAQQQQQQQKSNDEMIAVAEINRCSDKSGTAALVSELPSIGRTKRHISWQNIKKCVK